jgi:hypothetical protein
VLDRISVRGGGVSALCCAALLARRGISVDLFPRKRFYLPALVIGDTTAALLRDLFDNASILDSRNRLRARVTDWSSRRPASVIEYESWVVAEEALLTALRRSIERDFDNRVRIHPSGAAPLSQLTIVAGGPVPGRSHRFGQRRAAWRIASDPVDDPSVSRMIADAGGWTFKVPLDSRTVFEQRAGIAGPDAWPCAPRITWPLFGPAWFACGPCAFALDPICGDGVGYAVRSAIWLCGLLAAHGLAGIVEARAGYETRLVLAFRDHLAACLEFYSEARFAPLWKNEIRATERGLAAMDKLLAALHPMRHRLSGFNAIRQDEPHQPGSVESLQ